MKTFSFVLNAKNAKDAKAQRKLNLRVFAPFAFFALKIRTNF